MLDFELNLTRIASSIIPLCRRQWFLVSKLFLCWDCSFRDTLTQTLKIHSLSRSGKT